MIEKKETEVTRVTRVAARCFCDRCGKEILGRYIRVTRSDYSYMEPGEYDAWQYCSSTCASRPVEDLLNDVNQTVMRGHLDYEVIIGVDEFKPGMPVE